VITITIMNEIAVSDYKISVKVGARHRLPLKAMERSMTIDKAARRSWGTVHAMLDAPAVAAQLEWSGIRQTLGGSSQL